MAAKIDLKSDAGITSYIEGVHRRENTLSGDVHRILYAIAARWNETGDVRIAVKHVNHLLDKGKLNGMRKNAIRYYVAEVFALLYIDEGPEKGTFTRGTITTMRDDQLEFVKNGPRWHEYKPEPEYKPVQDFAKFRLSLVKRMLKDRQEQGENSVIPAEFIEYLKEWKPAEANA